MKAELLIKTNDIFLIVGKTALFIALLLDNL